MTMKMKVKVVELKRAIVQHTLAEKANYVKAVTAYKEQQEKDAERHFKNVEKYFERLKNGGKPIDGYKLRDILDEGCKHPSEPREPSDHSDTLKKLELCVDQIVTVDD